MKSLAIWKWLAITLGLLAIVGGITESVLYTRYLNTLPRTPEERIGRTHPLNVHGIAVYLTAQEQRRLEAVDHATFGAVGLAMIVGFLYDRKRRQGSQLELRTRQ